MADYPVKWKHGDPPTKALVRSEAPSIRDYMDQGVAGDTTIARIIGQLYRATLDGKISWFRDAEYFAVTYFPMLAVTFRLQVSGSISSFGNVIASTPSGKGTDPTRAQHLTIAFMDNKEYKCLPASYPTLHQLTELVWSTFERPYVRDRNERLEWLDKALRVFLPHVVSSSVEPEDQT